MNDIVLLLDVTSLSLGIETEEDGCERIIDKNATIPTKKTKAFTTVENDQRRVRIHVLQGESRKASENISLGVFDLVGLARSPAGVPQVDVTFEIDANGMVRVSAKDVASGREQKMIVQPSSGLNPQQMNAIVAREAEKRTKGLTNGKTRLL